MISKKHRANFCKVTWKYFDPHRFYITNSYALAARRKLSTQAFILNRAVMKSDLVQELYSHYRLQIV